MSSLVKGVSGGLTKDVGFDFDTEMGDPKPPPQKKKGPKLLSYPSFPCAPLLGVAGKKAAL